MRIPLLILTWIGYMILIPAAFVFLLIGIVLHALANIMNDGQSSVSERMARNWTL